MEGSNPPGCQATSSRHLSDAEGQLRQVNLAILPATRRRVDLIIRQPNQPVFLSWLRVLNGFEMTTGGEKSWKEIGNILAILGFLDPVFEKKKT